MSWVTVTLKKKSTCEFLAFFDTTLLHSSSRAKKDIFERKAYIGSTDLSYPLRNIGSTADPDLGHDPRRLSFGRSGGKK